MSIKSFKSASRSVSITINKGPAETDDQEVITSTESELNWRNIIFIPFGSLWQLALQLSILVNSFWVVYIFSYNDRRREEDTEWIFYCTELYFAFDVFLLLTHKWVIHTDAQ